MSLQLKNQRSGSETLCGFAIISIWKNYDVLTSRSLYFVLIEIYKRNWKWKISHSFRETNLVFQLIQELQIKSETVVSWSSRKKNKNIFCTVYFARRNFFFNICVSSPCIVYWINFQNIHTFEYQKAFLHTLFCLFLKSLEAFSLSFQDFDKNAQEISVFSKFGWEMKKERKNVGQAGRCGQSGR